MALTLDTAWSAKDLTNASTATITPSGSPKAILLGLASTGSAGWSAAPKFGGITLTQLAVQADAPYAHTAVYYALDITGRADDVLRFYHADGSQFVAGALLLNGVDPKVGGYTNHGTGWTSGTKSTAMAAGVSGNSVAGIFATDAITTSTGVPFRTLQADHTWLRDNDLYGPSTRDVLSIAYRIGVDGDAIAMGSTGTIYYGGGCAGWLYEGESDRDFAPDAFGAEGGFQAGVAFALGEDVALRLIGAFGAEAGFQTGLRFGSAGARQVMLTGNGIETPEMTEGGAEGEVLTYHPDAKPTWEERGLTAAEVVALLSPDWYTCDSLTATKGTVDAGSHTDLHATGGTTVAISEVVGTPGISITFAFSTVDALTAWEVRGYYAGSASHEVDIQLWNYDTSAWDTVGVMPNESSQHVYSGTLADGTSYFDAGTGAAQMRLYHPDAGNTSHGLFLDYVVIGHTTSGGGALALDDLTDVNAPTPGDGNVLAWNEAAGEWQDVAPSAPSIDWAEAGDLTAVAFGDTADAGESIEVPRADHRHAAPADPVTAHEAAADPHTGYLLNTLYSTNRQSDTNDDYTLIASWEFDAQYDNVALTLHCMSRLSATVLPAALVHVRSGIWTSDTPFAYIDVTPLTRLSQNLFRAGDFTVVFTSVSGYAVTAELYYRYRSNYQEMLFSVISSWSSSGAAPTFYDDQAYGAALPDGTAVASVNLPEATYGSAIRASPYYDVLSADGDVVTTTPTLPPGIYWAMGRYNTTASSGSGTGRVELQFDGTVLDNRIARYNVIGDLPHVLFGYHSYAGGSPVIRLRFIKASGTSVTFGANGDARTVARLAWHRVGDIPVA